MSNKPIAHISNKVIQAIGLNCLPGTPIYIGASNIRHMQQKHPNDYALYHSCIPTILSNPDYVGVNAKDSSIEYVKEFSINGTDYVKIAVRISTGGKYYARSLYVLNPNRVKNFIQKGTLKPIP